MNDKESRLYCLYQLIIEGYSKTELVRKMQSGELFDEKIPRTTAYRLFDEARDMCKIDPEESDVLYSRLLAIYRGSMGKEDYSNAIKAVKELKEFAGNAAKKDEVTIKFVKE